MRRATFAGVLLSAALAVGSVAPAASAAQLTNVSQPLGFVTLDPCTNNQLVTFSGLTHEIFNVTSDGAGGFSVKVNINTQDVRGSDNFGDSYIFNDHVAESFHLQAGGDETAPVSEQLISQGSAPNASLKSLLHFTVDPNGNVSSSVDNFSISCQG